MLQFIASLVLMAAPPNAEPRLGPGGAPPPPPPGWCEPPATKKYACGASGCGWQCVQPPPVLRAETWFPGFKVVALFYAPPGKQSSVSYGLGSSAGSSQSTSFSTQTGVSYGGTLAFGAGVSVDQSFTFTTTSNHAERSQKSDTVTLGLSNGTGAQDVPDHGFDTFWLWVNPRVDLTFKDGVLVSQQWVTPDGNPPEVVPFTVREIQGIDAIPSYKLEKMNVPFRPGDAELLLELDPFLDPSYRPDPKRFRRITTQTLWGPDSPSDPVPSSTVAWTYMSGADDSFSTGEGERTAITATTGFDLFGLIKAQARIGGSFGVTFTQGTTESNSSTESATVMLRSNTPCHAMDVAVYLDKAFNTFVAMPIAEYHCAKAQTHRAVDGAGNPLASKLVTYQRRTGELIQTYTDAQGRYPVYP